jgi:hypothetical protein
MGADNGKETGGDGGKGARWEERLHDAGAVMEEELRRLITFINDEVVPEVRRNSSVALRAAAEQMEKLAKKMDEGRGRGAAGPGSAGSGKGGVE